MISLSVHCTLPISFLFSAIPPTLSAFVLLGLHIGTTSTALLTSCMFLIQDKKKLRRAAGAATICYVFHLFTVLVLLGLEGAAGKGCFIFHQYASQKFVHILLKLNVPCVLIPSGILFLVTTTLPTWSEVFWLSPLTFMAPWIILHKKYHLWDLPWHWYNKLCNVSQWFLSFHVVWFQVCCTTWLRG